MIKCCHLNKYCLTLKSWNSEINSQWDEFFQPVYAYKYNLLMWNSFQISHTKREKWREKNEKKNCQFVQIFSRYFLDCRGKRMTVKESPRNIGNLFCSNRKCSIIFIYILMWKLCEMWLFLLAQLYVSGFFFTLLGYLPRELSKYIFRNLLNIFINDKEYQKKKKKVSTNSVI